MFQPSTGRNQTQQTTIVGISLGVVTFAAGHTPRVSFTWANAAARGSEDQLGTCNTPSGTSGTSDGCRGWVDVGLYEPVYQGVCWIDQKSHAADNKLVTITDDGTQFCSQRALSPSGDFVITSGTFQGEVPISKHLLGSWLLPSNAPPTFSRSGTSTVSSNVCGVVSSYPVSAATVTGTVFSTPQWCTPSTLSTRDENILFLGGSAIQSNNLPNNENQQSPVGKKLEFYVSVQ